MKSKILIDTDIGSDVDDAIAVTLALKSSELEVVGITTVYGDTLLRARIALKLLKLIGTDHVPVAAGIEKPLLRERDVWWTGHEGKGILTEEDEELKPIEKHAVDFIIEKIMENPREITLVTIGPLTNIATAIIKEPKIIENVKEIVMMGGVARIFKNALNLPYIEHNIKCDPEAASVVFNSGIPITMVGLDVTMRVPINRSHLEKIRRVGTPLSEVLVRLIEIWWDFLKFDFSCMHDPLAVSYCIKPEFLKTINCKVLVETKGKYTPGLTIVIPDENSNIKVAYDVDEKVFLKFLMSKICS
ncbi:nucleoside hydrolase [Thermotoga sp.]|uniref:nucleoside hydrolase n=1 Tax=Thermotoga sp. TaxID=28240 RepID=UPI0025F00033|nr:nucleoside hydrolase [Thermotoga sp.]MCD6551713.1 nucleoside hydrolase [Thermotoga sp.]